ncbi:origin recognition complex subunit 1-like [Tropilaelaps mercedesae]|uniref:Origin recognition complex subunit 1 n=1 Tax=Tropilaelaps mercedesae TaxID=418985 RepID=A0A1V9XYI1_9ACAR|nr:origin recognition complex subunit 1-like [Tropilaelaps mercedesae]
MGERIDEDRMSNEGDVETAAMDFTDKSNEEDMNFDDGVILKPKTKLVQIPNRGTKRAASTQCGSTWSVSRAPAIRRCLNIMRATSRGTPQMPSRRVIRERLKDNDFENALEKLHVCAIPEQLSCRETQFAEIYDFIENRLSEETGGCMYISGAPGTGKSATIREVMEALNKAQKTNEVAKFKYIEINGMKLTKPHQAYVRILKQLTGRTATPERAADILTKIFTGKEEATNGAMVVLLADELDLLWTRKQQVLYNLFDWPTHPSSRLVVIAIANTMDLPERVFINKVTSRMGLSRITFQPYTFQELQEILNARLVGHELMDPDAIELVSRKVAALSGDARRALELCRRSVELLGKASYKIPVGSPPTLPIKEANTYPVTTAHVEQAIQEMFYSAKVMAIRSLSTHEQLLLRAIVQEFKRTGAYETVFHKVQSQYDTLARLDGVVPVNCTLLSTMLARLGSWRLVTLSDSRHDFHQKIFMNFTQDERREVPRSLLDLTRERCAKMAVARPRRYPARKRATSMKTPRQDRDIPKEVDSPLLNTWTKSAPSTQRNPTRWRRLNVSSETFECHEAYQQGDPRMPPCQVGSWYRKTRNDSRSYGSFKAQKINEVAKFKYIGIHGTKLRKPHQAYVRILKQLTDRKATPERAADILTKIFTGKEDATGVMVVLLADELDLLWTGKQQVLYNLFYWPTHLSSRLVVIAIANTMDIPERVFINKVTSYMRISAQLTGLESMDRDAVQRRC